MAKKRTSTKSTALEKPAAETAHAPPDIRDLVQGFAEHIRYYKSTRTKEAEVRLRFIDPFWRALGWTIGDPAVNPADAEVIIEKSVEIADAGGLRNRRPDYLFRLGGFSRFIVEAKKPSVDLDADRHAIFQAKQYAWNSTIPFAVLTDFEQFRVFDTTLMPNLHQPARGLIEEFKLDYHQYESQWDAIRDTFGRDAVASGSLEQLLAKVKKLRAGRRVRTADRMLIDIRGTEPVDRAFLDFLAVHRKHFARTVYRRNKRAFPEANTLHGTARLTEAVQRIMDRLVFMRVIEDREIVEYGALRDMLERTGTGNGAFYEALCATFRQYDRQYNGYLFKPHFSEELDVDGDVLADFTRTLYPPENPWDFAAIGDDILGIVYERFLGNVVTVEKGHAVIEEKPEVRHAGGVYYTPRFIVDSIIRRVIGPKIEGKTPAEVLDVKILDPACGSGSFLVAALQHLFDYCLSAVHDDPTLARAHVDALDEGTGRKGRRKKSEIAFKDKEGQWYLAPDFRSALLTHCIHGVDIDQQAVEVTVMSLYLKMLESKLPENWATLWVEKQLLPPLENNIRCGNSLIDEQSYDAYLMEKKRSLFGEDKDTAFRINRFDWHSRTRGFGRVIGDSKNFRGFDCIIGNPPYIRVQGLKKWAPEEAEFYKWKYTSARKGNYDIYVVFTEKALSLLAKDGLLGFIMPHKWWQAKYGEGLRKLISVGKHLSSLVDFTHNIVFRDASIYTAIHVFSKTQNSAKKVPVVRINELYDGPGQVAAAERGVPMKAVALFTTVHPVGSEPWAIVPPSIAKAMLGLQQATATRLGDVTDRMAQGIRTSMNPVYVLTRTGKRSKRYFSEHLGEEVELEPDLLLAFLSAEHMRRYEIEPTSQVVLVPYYTEGSDIGSLIPSSEIEAKYPATWDYLKRCEKALRGRENGRMNQDEWYGYVYPKNLTVMGSPKILVPDIIERATFSLDANGEYAFVSGYGITLKQEYADLPHYLVALLNSAPLSDFLKAVSTTLRGGWYRPFPQFMEQIPIKLPETAAERKLAEQIEQCVRAVMDAKTVLRKPKLSDGEQRRLESTIETNERRIDEAVFKLYGVDGLPA